MFKNINTQNKAEYDEFLTETQTKTKSRSILSGALLWVALGLIFLALFTYLEAKTMFFANMVENNTQTVVIVGIIAIIFILIGNFTVYFMPWWLVLIYYITFTMVEGIYIGYILLYAFQDFTTAEFTLLLAIPGGAVLIMGLLGYFNVINFGKIWPLILGLFIAILVFGIISYFVSNHLYFAMYASIGFLAYSLMIGFQVWKIKRMDEDYIGAASLSFGDYMKTTLIIGTSLLVSILELIRYTFILIKLAKVFKN
ncbi:Uncharacterised protein [Mycoplasmopsis californica]|uniref:Bax inhibitor-1 family protein n=1 Tax=Mycoplasmopsis equigenitalium TaxID=114883 RepID=A0ABY5J180_9BACT|nr:Bax inhibitor-1 family protein [Mycoplasmopsis equigenitalium]UUD37017.1 Bax inhibitor-1 family protein [Mycoplasmopsis equigenitalium]VEU69684.1 Uncharacterised protein [Mycoplasmopsis californica]